MLYLINEIRVSLLLAAIFAFILGWIFKGVFTKKSASPEEVKELRKENDNLMEKLYDMKASSSSKVVEDNHGNGDYDITEIEGIGPGYKAKMDEKFGINNVTDFLEKTATPDGRASVAEALKLEVKIIDKWTRMADFTRIAGVRGHFAELIEAAGLESIGHFAAQDSKELTDILIDVNSKSKHSRIDPTFEMVEDWVKKASELEEVIA